MNSDRVPIAFNAQPWEDIASGARGKVINRDTACYRLLELTPQFAEEGWCIRGHRGLVLEGSVEISLCDGAAALHAGDGIYLEPGESFAHRARALSPRALLFLVEDPPPRGSPVSD
jgi:hypothetical protein